jgi:acylphosphatase
LSLPPGQSGLGGSVRRRVVVSGRVQGVWFRESCRQQALERSVGGWVRNCDDGTVEAVFEGSPAAVEAMVAWCRAGPPHASVTSVVSTEEAPIGEMAFRVR